MKKVMTLALALVMLLSLAACGGSSSAPSATAAPKEAAAPAPTKAPTPEPTEAPAAEWEVVSTGVETWTSSIGTPWIRAWVEIENTGDLPLYLGSTSFDIEDENGKLLDTLGTVNGFPQVLLPGERGVYEESTMAEDGMPKEGMSVYSRLNVTEAKVDCVRLDVSDFEVKADKYKQIKGMGRIVNGTGEEQSLVYVAALLYDADGTYLGTVWTILSDKIPDGEKQGFETMAAEFPLNLNAVASWAVYAYPYHFQF